MRPTVRNWGLSDQNGYRQMEIAGVSLDLTCPLCNRRFTGYFLVEGANRIILDESESPICDHCLKSMEDSNVIQS